MKYIESKCWPCQSAQSVPYSLLSRTGQNWMKTQADRKQMDEQNQKITWNQYIKRLRSMLSRQKHRINISLPMLTRRPPDQWVCLKHKNIKIWFPKGECSEWNRKMLDSRTVLIPVFHLTCRKTNINSFLLLSLQQYLPYMCKYRARLFLQNCWLQSGTRVMLETVLLE